jgi:hypothetical protein
MDKTHDYQIISDTAPAIQTALAARAVEGWRPILMSTAAASTGEPGVYRFREIHSSSLHKVISCNLTGLR